MANLCRTLFPTLLEEEGLLSKLLLDHFDQSHSLYEDIINQYKESDFKNYIYSLIDVENKNEIVVQKTPKELLSEAGYDLYECRSEEEIQSFKKYYEKDEELCTFNGGRLDRCHVFFAVKKDVDKIKREDFKNPKRQDLYGTSVISIQFTRDQSHTLSIKNRYNHAVNNPDATYSNNLDNIVEGLTESFEREYGLIQEHKNIEFELEGYVRANDGKYYKYNKEIGNIYYCRNNVIIDNFKVKKYEKEKYIVFDYFILDLVNKEIKLYDKRLKDSFPESIEKIDKIEIENKDKYKQVKIITKGKEDVKIILNEDNELIGLDNPNLEEIGDYLLYWNDSLIYLNLPNLKEVGDYFLYQNDSITELTLTKLKKVGASFLSQNHHSLIKLDLPSLKEVGDGFLCWNKSITKLDFPKVQKVGDYFLGANEVLKTINLPNLEKAGDRFLHWNNSIVKLNLPNLKETGDYFLYWNKSITDLNLPQLEKVGDEFLHYNNSLTNLSLPNLKEVGHSFLSGNATLKIINLPNLKEVRDNFLYWNNSITNLSLPNLKEVGYAFLSSHPIINESNYKMFNKGDEIQELNERRIK